MFDWLPQLFILVQLLCAMAFGALIGLERQWRQRTAGLRTNALVALGSAAFVITGAMVDGEISPTRIAAQVVSGIGFLCAGVIMRDGFSVRGLNTAATLWCSAAVGVMVGMGFLFNGLLITLTVLLAHLVLRPLSDWLNRRPVDTDSEVPISYQLRVVCKHEDEAHIRALLMHMLAGTALMLRGLTSRNDTDIGADYAVMEAQLSGFGEQNSLLERWVTRLSLEGTVREVSWKEHVALNNSDPTVQLSSLFGRAGGKP